MKSVREGLREGELEKDTYDRLVCVESGKQLKTKNDPDSIETLRICPETGQKWKEVR
ncbi:HVO_0758 family zinc finger protein [Natrarchaeobius sp. A-rgal3]|uniref:HVO_0758 family zinc finger protein n=1 Tax=Natrarchaeobius versutus TaxID=1679078 RepID=UPI0035102FBA